MSVKTESQLITGSKIYTKKLYCPEHGNKLYFKCEYIHCPSPYLCHSSECIEAHFHQENGNKLILAKFDCQNIANKLGQLEILFTKEDFAAQAKKLKVFIDELKNNMVNIHREYKDLQNKKQTITKACGQNSFSQDFMKQVQGALSVGFNLKNQLNTLKSKLRMASHYVSDQKKSNHIQQAQFLSKPLIQNHFQPQFNQIQSQHQESVQKSFLDRSSHMSDVQEVQSVKKSDQILNFNSNCKEVESRSNSSRKQILDMNGKYKSFEDLFNEDANQNSTKRKQPELEITKLSTKYQGNNHLAVYQKNFILKKQLTIFFQKNIDNFSWGLTEQIYSSSRQPKSCQKFHEMLQGKNNLLFLFIGDKTVIGSFYPSRYPKLTEKLRFDNKSFLFVSDQNKVIHKFKAMLSQFHLSVSERTYICHGNTPSYADGIRTFEKNFDSLNYCLPSFSYKYEDISNQDESKDFNGVLKVKQFFILQYFPPKTKN